jgi:hypothetical protein
MSNRDNNVSSILESMDNLSELIDKDEEIKSVDYIQQEQDVNDGK